MKIQGPLVIDVSTWVDHLDTNKLIDGGVVSVIVGLYQDRSGPRPVLDKKSRQHCEAVAKTPLILQAYYWDDIIFDPVAQAEWLAETARVEGFPFRWFWADQEQWWTNWPAWYRMRRGEITGAQVPRASATNISWHNQRFMESLYGRLPNSGIYCNKSFIAEYTAFKMDVWAGKYLQWVAHYGRQPKPAVKMTWETLKAKWLPNYDFILSACQNEGNVVGHQFTGDACILPGSYNIWDGKIPYYDGRLPLDVSVFKQDFIDKIRLLQPAPAGQQPAVPQSQELPQIIQHTTEVLDVRKGPLVTDTIIGRIGKGIAVVVDQVDVLHARSHIVSPMTGWILSHYIGK